MASPWEPLSHCSHAPHPVCCCYYCRLVPMLAQMILCVASFIIDWWNKPSMATSVPAVTSPRSQLLHGVRLHYVPSTFVCALDLAWLHALLLPSNAGGHVLSRHCPNKPSDLAYSLCWWHLDSYWACTPDCRRWPEPIMWYLKHTLWSRWITVVLMDTIHFATFCHPSFLSRHLRDDIPEQQDRLKVS